MGAHSTHAGSLPSTSRGELLIVPYNNQDVLHSCPPHLGKHAGNSSRTLTYNDMAVSLFREGRKKLWGLQGQQHYCCFFNGDMPSASQQAAVMTTAWAGKARKASCSVLFLPNNSVWARLRANRIPQNT